MTRMLVVMGSGETTPTMIKPHRSLFATLPAGARAVLLDTPYGFQPNADEISTRAVGYFSQSVGQQVEVVSWRRAPEPGLERERALAALRGASWIFAGPGSPTYALRQWRDTDLPGLLCQADVLVFASAAALTIGSHTIPVYEIYKAGAEPHWLPGLNLFEQLTGVPGVVIPHFDNAEGGHHDTRYCYLGEPRLARLERELPDGAVIVGVDEHTALVCDLDARTATVVGNGGLTVRRAGVSAVYAAGTTLPLPFPDERKGPLLTLRVEDGPLLNAVGAGKAQEATSLREAADRVEERFARALAARDLDGCVAATLELEQTITDWTADTNDSADGEHARGLLRSMVVRLGELAGDADPVPLLTPLVLALLAVREAARERRDWAAADQVRDALAAARVEVRDTSDGPVWAVGT